MENSSNSVRLIQIHPSLLENLLKIYSCKGKIYSKSKNEQVEIFLDQINFYGNGQGSEILTKLNKAYDINNELYENSKLNQIINTSLYDATYLTSRKEILILYEELSNLISCLESQAVKYTQQNRITRGIKINSKASDFFQFYIDSLSPFLDKIEQTAIKLENIPLLSSIKSEELNGITSMLKDENLFNEIKSIFNLSINFDDSSNRIDRVTNLPALRQASSIASELSTVLMKFANDVRFVSSGPRSGLGEMSIPENEPGSSIMPGKVNPTQCESLTMVCSQVLGNSSTISIALSCSLFEGNNFLPLISNNLVRSLVLLSDGVRSFRTNCLQGVEFITSQLDEEVKSFKILLDN